MPAFSCDRCGTLEHVGLCNFWAHKIDRNLQLCSGCDPMCHGWHGRFERRPAEDLWASDGGFLWSPSEIQSGHIPVGLKLLGYLTEVTPLQKSVWDKPLETLNVSNRDLWYPDIPWSVAQNAVQKVVSVANMAPGEFERLAQMMARGDYERNVRALNTVGPVGATLYHDLRKRHPPPVK